MKTRSSRFVVLVVLFSLFLSSCGQATSVVPANPTTTSTAALPPSTSEAKNPDSSNEDSLAGFTPVVMPPINERMENRKDSNQILEPFNPTELFIFALPDWKTLEGMDVAQKIHASVVGSCHQDMDWRLQKWLDNADVLSRATDIAHKAGLRYTTTLTTDRDNKDGSIPFEEEAAVRDIDGNKIFFSMPEEQDQRVWKSVHYPEWKEYMINLAEKAVDAGVDILCIDSWTYNYDVISIRGGDFSENCLSGFKEYIKNKYTAGQLADFGIGDINTFDYREYKKSSPKDPLMNDFEDFQLSSSKVFWQEIIDKTRQYAETIGKEVLFTVNVNVSFWELVPGLPIANSVDGFMSEYRYQLPPYNSIITEFKLFQSLGKSQVLIPNAGASADFLQRTDLAEIMKIYTAAAYASGEFIYPPYSALVMAPGGWKFFNADMEKLYPYYDFIAGNPSYFDHLKSTANTALLFSYASQKNKENNRAYQNFFGIGAYLLDTHRQFDVLFAGDNRWMDDDLTIDQLIRYQAVVMPNVADISDAQLDLILGYVKQGGIVFAFAETGLRNEFGQPGDRPVLRDLLVEGTHRYGLGLFIYAPLDIGVLKDIKLKQKFFESMQGLIPENLQTDAADTVSILEYWSTSSGTSVIHLINNDYDIREKHINQQHNISMDVPLNSLLLGKDLAVTYASPDWDGLKELEFSISNNRISFIIPDLDTYGIITIGEKYRKIEVPFVIHVIKINRLQ